MELKEDHLCHCCGKFMGWRIVLTDAEDEFHWFENADGHYKEVEEGQFEISVHCLHCKQLNVFAG